MRYQKKKNWKYKVFSDCFFRLHTTFPRVKHKFFTIDKDILTVKAGYVWDGATSAIDSDNFMSPSLVHDVLYQAIREGSLDEIWKKDSDTELKKMCLQRGMSSFRAWYIHFAVDKFGGSSIKSDIIEVE